MKKKPAEQCGRERNYDHGKEKIRSPRVFGRGRRMAGQPLWPWLCHRRFQCQMVCEVRLGGSYNTPAGYADHRRRHVLHAGVRPRSQHSRLPPLCQVLLWRQIRQRGIHSVRYLLPDDHDVCRRSGLRRRGQAAGGLPRHQLLGHRRDHHSDLRAAVPVWLQAAGKVLRLYDVRHHRRRCADYYFVPCLR